MDKRRKRKNVNKKKEELHKKNERKKATDKASKEYLDSMLRGHGTSKERGHGTSKKGPYDLMYMKTKDVGWKENRGVQNNAIEDAQKNMTEEQK
jgi:hypothetical protein